MIAAGCEGTNKEEVLMADMEVVRESKLVSLEEEFPEAELLTTALVLPAVDKAVVDCFVVSVCIWLDVATVVVDVDADCGFVV